MAFNDTKYIDNVESARKDSLRSDASKRIWRKHQQNEHTRIDKDKEGVCFGCFNKTFVGARVADICADCFKKRGTETVLAFVNRKMYGFCLFCGKYKFNVSNINVRICIPCNTRISRIAHDFNKAGGKMNVDPFFQRMKKKYGKDWLHLGFEPWYNGSLGLKKRV